MRHPGGTSNFLWVMQALIFAITIMDLKGMVCASALARPRIWTHNSAQTNETNWYLATGWLKMV